MAIPDDFASCPPSLTSPFVLGADVTPHDDNDLAFKPRAITCRVAGLVALRWPDGTSSIHSIAVGLPLWVRPTRILATGTTATGLAILK